MTRTTSLPGLSNRRRVQSINQGGTSGDDPVEAAINLRLVTKDMVGDPLGPVALDATSKIPASSFSTGSKVSLNGSLFAIISQAVNYEITDYDSNRVYNISVTAGSVTRNGSALVFTPPPTAQIVTLTVNGKNYTVDVSVPAPQKPILQAPVNNATVYTVDYNFVASAFVAVGDASTHASTDWQIATDPLFVNTFRQSLNDVANKTSWSVTGMPDGTTLYARVRYKGSNGNFGLWSSTATFTIAVPVPVTPSITFPLDNAIGVAPVTTFTSNSFAALADASSHASTDWQLATDSAFTTIFRASLADTVNKTSWNPGALNTVTMYFLRIRHRSSNGKASAWSSPVVFTTSNAFMFNYVIAANTMNYNMRASAVLAGWDQVRPLVMSLTVNPGIYVGSSTPTGYALDTGVNFPAGTELTLINKGFIIGRGGNAGNGAYADYGTCGSGTPGQAGSPAFRAQQAISIDNSLGTIGGGGGGGGGAASTRNWWSGNGQFNPHGGGGGGGGQGYTPGAGGSGAGGTMSNGTAGTAGTLTARGVGQTPNGFPGGHGGTLGNPGLVGSWNGSSEAIPYDFGVTPGAGGAAGASVTGNGFITWIGVGIISGTGQTVSHTYNRTISADTTNYDMRADAVAAGWDQVKPLIMTVTVNAGIAVGSTSTSTYAFDTGASFPSGSVLSLINNGVIVGKGGNGGTGAGWNSTGSIGTNGGPALRAQYPLSINNTNGTIGAGGGGGGGAGTAFNNGTGEASGGGGGGGAGYTLSVGGPASSSGVVAVGATGSPGTKTAGGAGGASGFGAAPYGGNGGALGANGGGGGSAANLGGAGGVAGITVTNAYNVTWNGFGSRPGFQQTT